MGTRSLTIVKDDDEVLVCMYRQFDGYPEGHGQELCDFLKDFRIVNGLKLEDRGAKVANGPGCLAAQIVAHFKEEPGGIYLLAPNNRSCGQEYEYHVTVANYLDTEPMRLQVQVRDMWSDSEIFRGHPSQFNQFLTQLAQEQE